MPYGIKTRHDRKLSALKKRVGPSKPRRPRSVSSPGYQSPVPYSSQYDTTVGGLSRDRDQGLLDVSGRELAVKQQYGFEDPSNPFSQARMLERDYAQRQAGTQNSYAARGQLYSGALGRQKETDRFGFEHGLDTAQREYQAELAGLARERLGLSTDYGEGVLGAGAERLEDALSERPTAQQAPRRRKPPAKGPARGPVHKNTALRKRLGKR